MEQQVDPAIELKACELAKSKSFTELMFHLVNFSMGGPHNRHAVLLALQKRHQMDLEECVKNERRQCARIAKAEPLLKGEPPYEVALKMLNMTMKENVVNVMQVTKDSIAKKIEERGV